MASEKSSIGNLLQKGWIHATSRQHPLGNLQEKGLGSYRLVVLLGPKNRIGARYLQLFSRNAEISQQPVVIGLYNTGEYPSYNWIEIMHFSLRVAFGSGREASAREEKGLDRELFQALAELLPPGGHMMVEYDSPEREDTARSLSIGIPPAATPVGYLLFSVGCGAGFKDWYFAEGASEGPRKLQGYKALNSQHARLKARELAEELEGFLNRLPKCGGSELERAARERALAVISILERKNAEGASAT
ncbi:MAG: DUF1122 family protein [Chloroflexota bacterium]